MFENSHRLKLNALELSIILKAPVALLKSHERADSVAVRVISFMDKVELFEIIVAEFDPIESVKFQSMKLEAVR